MQTRTVNQVLIYKLFLNESRFNISDLAAVSYDTDKLSKWMDSYKVDEYIVQEDMSDELEESNEKVIVSIKKCFDKESPLYIYNMGDENQKIGIFPQWINEEDFEKFKSEYPTIPIIE